MPIDFLPADMMVAIMFLVLGFIFMAIEITILPGFGIMGLLGLASLAYGCWEMGRLGGARLGMSGAVAGLVITVLAARAFFRSRKGKSLVLENEVEGTSVNAEEFEELVGSVGRVTSALRPSGIVEVHGRRYDAVCGDGEFLKSGVSVEVEGHEHGQLRVVVRGNGGEDDSGK